MVQLRHKQEKVFGYSSHIFLGMCFQMFLAQRRETYPAHLNVIQLDNGKFHQSSSLKIPDNILLIFQPPYSSELNPIERIWSHIKQKLSWEISKNLDGLKEKVGAFLAELSTEEIASIAGWDYILSPTFCRCGWDSFICCEIWEPKRF
jgi:transposase